MNLSFQISFNTGLQSVLSRSPNKPSYINLNENKTFECIYTEKKEMTRRVT